MEFVDSTPTVVINQHGVIICGHQRVRACVELGIADVPVIVREVGSDQEHETLLIEENLRRRQLLPSESFRAVKRLYELNGLDGVKGGQAANRATVAQLAENQNKSERTFQRMRTLADLIPPEIVPTQSKNTPHFRTRKEKRANDGLQGEPTGFKTPLGWPPRRVTLPLRA